MEAGKHVLCEKPLATVERTGSEMVRSRKGAQSRQLHFPQSALLPAGSKHAPHARSRRTRRNPMQCRAPIRRIGCSTTQTTTGASKKKPTAAPAPLPISAPTGATWRNTSRACVSPRSAPTCRPSIRPAKGLRARSRPSPGRRCSLRLLRGPYRYRRLRRGPPSPGRQDARRHYREPGFGWPQEPPVHRDLRHEGSVVVESGAPGRTMDRPAQHAELMVVKDPSLLHDGREVCRFAWRPQRRLRRHLQAGLPQVL